jgi:hypothetical protein
VSLFSAAQIKTLDIETWMNWWPELLAPQILAISDLLTVLTTPLRRNPRHIKHLHHGSEMTVIGCTGLHVELKFQCLRCTKQSNS